MTIKGRKIVTLVLIVVAIPFAIGSFLVYGFIGPLTAIFVAGYIIGVYIND